MENFRVPPEPYLPVRWTTVDHGDLELGTPDRKARSICFPLARNALFFGLRAMGLSPGQEIIVPAFICRVVTESIEACGGTPILVDVDPDCSWNMDAVRARVSDRTRGIVAVHYFGHPADLSGLQALCRERRLYLIEDCAHTIDVTGHHGVGTRGDLAIFSLRKFVSAPDGALLVVNDPKLSVQVPALKAPALINLRAGKSMLDEAFKGGWRPGLRGFLESIRGLVRREHPPANTYRQHGQTEMEPAGDHFDMERLYQPMSGLSRFLLRHSDVHLIAEARRRNYEVLAKALAAIGGFQPLFDAAAPGVAPWAIAVATKGRCDIHLRFRQRGIPVTHWGGVRPAQALPTTFPVSDRLYEELVFLPVHQDLEAWHLQLMIDEAAALSSRR